MFAVATSGCAEGVREFSPPPTLTATTPPAATTTPRPITAAPSTAAPASPSATAAAASPTPSATTAATSVPVQPSPARSATPTPAPTAASSPQPTLPPGASLPPMPAQPPLSASPIANGTVAFSIAPGETRKFEPSALIASRGASPQPTTAFVWTIAWRAVEPLSAAWYRDTSRTELGRGRWGTADLGGAGFELRNDTSASVFGELSYLIGSR